MSQGKLYLIPVPLGEESLPSTIFSISQLEIISSIKEFIVENEKSARAFLKKAETKIPMQELILHPIGKHISVQEKHTYLNSCKKGATIGLLSEAGCPGVADPGAEIVRLAHEAKIKVIPLIGPSSLLLALMGSGMNGQQFHFHGYLPIDKTERMKFLKNIERDSKQNGTTNFFIETPFRNNQLMEDVLKTLDHSTRFCIACDLTLSTEFIQTQMVGDWKKNPLPDLHKRPAVFLIGK